MKVTMKSNKGIHRVYVDGVLKYESNSLTGAWEFVESLREEKRK